MNKTIFCFWTDDNPMSKNRIESVESLRSVTGLPVQLVTRANLDRFILEDDPLPEEYEFLSAVHRADYLRCYFMHHHGGGYSDIKRATKSWTASWDAVSSDENLWISGYKEIGPGGVAHKDYRHLWESLIGNGCYICRPRTPLTQEWYDQLKSKIKGFSDTLKKFPARETRDKKENYGDKSNCYPIEWNEILGRIFHPLVYKYRDHVDMSLPKLIFSNYQ